MSLMNEPGLSASEPYEFELTGGALCLDFANTLGDRPRATEEHLESYEDLLRWSRQAEPLPVPDLDELVRIARQQPELTASVFERAIVLRESIYRIFSRLAADKHPADEDFERLNSALPCAMRQLLIREQEGSFQWGWSGPSTALDRPLWPVIRSAAELLTSEERSRIRECASETCSWLFLDRSRNRRRRWCDMSTCGNRAKARRHYARRKRSQASK